MFSSTEIISTVWETRPGNVQILLSTDGKKGTGERTGHNTDSWASRKVSPVEFTISELDQSLRHQTHYDSSVM